MAGQVPQWSKSDKGNRVLQPYQPQRSAVTGVLDALKAVANHTSAVEPPCWLEAGKLPDPTNVIAFANGLLDVQEYLAGSVTLLDHTPNWFSCNCLPHGFDPMATCPTLAGVPGSGLRRRRRADRLPPAVVRLQPDC